MGITENVGIHRSLVAKWCKTWNFWENKKQLIQENVMHRNGEK